MGLKGRGAPALQPKRLPVHGEAQHLQGRLERAVGGVSLLPDDAVAGRDVLAPRRDTPAGRAPPAGLVDDLQVEDDATSLDLPGFDPAVEDADSLREGGGVQAGREAARGGEGGRHGVRAGEGAPGHPVAAVNVFLQLVSGRQGVEFGRRGHGRGRGGRRGCVGRGEGGGRRSAGGGA